MSEKTVSIAMITYNHERFIAQAIESVMMQETDFDFELVIGEDCSTDQTRAIVEQCQQMYPDKIKVLLPSENLGVIRNLIQVLKACRGKYLALLEGDDYWTSPYKLQRQVEFLESRPDYATCFHNVTTVFADENREPYLFCPHDQKETSRLTDLLHSPFIPTCSTMFRNYYFGNLPCWFYSLKFGDWPLHVLHAQRGNIGYINDALGVYRIHRGGISAMRGGVKELKEQIKSLKAIRGHLGNNFASETKPLLLKWQHQLAVQANQVGDLKTARRYALKNCFEFQYSRYGCGSRKELVKIILSGTR